VLPLCAGLEDRDEGPLPVPDESTALEAELTALGARSTALGARFTALGTESTAPREESTAPPWASAWPDSARTNAAAVVIVLTEFIRLDSLIAAVQLGPTVRASHGSCLPTTSSGSRTPARPRCARYCWSWISPGRSRAIGVGWWRWYRAYVPQNVCKTSSPGLGGAA
jgi:hypothetical protein